MTTDGAAGCGNVVGAGLSVQADREVSQHGHDGRSVTGPDLGEVFGEGDVADPVQPVLDAPVCAERVGELGGGGLGQGQVGDCVDRLGAPAAGPSARLLRRWTCRASRGWGKPRPAATAVTLTVRVWIRPWPLSLVWSATGTSAQGSARSWRSSVG